MRILNQDLSLRLFLTLGPYEKDRGFRDLLRSIAQKGLLVYGLLGIIIVVFFVVSHAFLAGKNIAWTYVGLDPQADILILDKILIFLLCSALIPLSRSSISLRWIRILVSVLVWLICLAMLIEDIAGGDTSFTTAYTTLALLLAVVMVPYTGWQTALLSLVVIISTNFALMYLPGFLGMSLLRLRLGQTIFISVVAFILTGISSQIYINRYEQYRARKEAEELSEILEERANVLQMLKEKSEKQAEKILENEKLKDRFFANISHEFRTPLTLILGPLNDLLGGNPKSENIKVNSELLRLMQKNGIRLLDYINQLLDLSKIDAEEIRLKPKKLELTEFIQKSVDAFVPLAESQKVSLHIEAEQTPIIAEVDPVQFERVIGNLVSNAIKFTPHGGSVIVSVSKEDAPDGLIQISVKDNGIGISEENLRHIFDRFYQAPSAEGTFSRGTGIGLALVKEIVELHNGSIEVKSKLGEGSKFVVALNETLPESELSIPVDESQFPSLEPYNAGEMELVDFYDYETLQPAPEDASVVLLVDDNPDILTYLQPRLSERYNVLATESSKEALQLIKQEKIDLVISDVMMPEPDGFELCRFIKDSSELNHIPVILLTAQAAEESRIEGLELGADDYISKPFSASELLVRVENLIDLRRLLRNKFSEEIRLEGTEVEVDSEDARFLKQVQSVIEKHMENSNFGVDWLADEINLSTRQLQRKISAITDLSAGGYIRMMRLERAVQLISQEWGNISEIAYKVGFQDPKYFSKLFKQTFGTTPTEYTENNA